jgi:hypothetical protein
LIAFAGHRWAQMPHLMHFDVSTTGMGRLEEPTMRCNVAAIDTTAPPM